MKLLARMLGVAALLVVTACAGDGGPTDPDEEDESSFTASVSSVAFTGETFNIPIVTGDRLSFTVNQVVPPAANTHRFEISLEPIGTGNFPVGPGSDSHVVYMEVIGGGVTRRWRSSLPGGSGSVNVTTYTSERVAGSFSITVGPDSGATGTKTITGNFNIFR